ncbi:oligosaccharide repeat unit polymerase [Bacillus cereus]|uniref:Oligosaccharide repeat unit polymerase n=1 Tax=Bacillus anthracis TaxID=1392 RepID=A0A0J1HTM6_BACAN|nr:MULTISPECIES: O-antigen polymerase [Bacillus]ARZ65303.1 hypothetical protein B7P25_27300 [Bacillus thuringiensis]KLV17052.1 hypothetical protein ABW01_17660 [Bacillus anthracis]MCU5531047.1 oligosaccharide repeat unit polymerase [Bacillus cereus]MDA2005054.1 O-antigen ligase [Bacillus cereus]MDA2044557.1 O-antigen ligase [Bacillus cereus]
MTIELFNGGLKANPYFIIFNSILIFHFIYSYWKYSYVKGFKVDYWHYSIFIGYVLPYMLIYPFAASPFNSISTGNQIYILDDYVDQAYLVTIIGYIFTYIGFYYFNFTYKNSYIYKITNSLNTKLSKPVNVIRESESVRAILIFVTLTCFLSFYMLVFVKYGFSMNLRGYMLADGTLRPIYNFIMISIIPFMLSIIIMLYKDEKKLGYLIICFIIIGIMSFSGSRGNLLWPILNCIVIILMAKQNKASSWKLVGIGVLFLFTALFLENFRKSDINSTGFLMGLANRILYGNNFSDLRDFAWVLAYWDDTALMGKSYLAALMSFLPREISDFRQHFSISVFTNNLVGFNSDEHAGLRPGKFGEVYFNFKIYGVAVYGFLTGYILRYTDFKIKENIINSNGHQYVYLFSLTILQYLVSYTFVTAGFWKVYVTIVFLLLIWFLKLLLRNPFYNPKWNQ